MKNLIDEILKVHNKEFARGTVENQGASIDAIALVHKLASHKRYTNNKKALAILIEIEAFEIEHNDVVSKYAKPLTKFAQNTAYHSVRKALA